MNIMLMDLSPDRSHSVEQVLYLAQALHKDVRNHVVLAVRPDSWLHKQAEASGLNVHSVYTGPAKGFMNKVSLDMHIRKHQHNWIIHCNDPESSVIGAKLAHKNPRLRLMHSRRTAESVSNSKLADIYRNSHAIACETKEIAHTMAEAGLPPMSLVVIPGCIEPEKYPHRKPRSDGRVNFVCNYPLKTGKGHEQLLRALPHLLHDPDMPPWELRFPEDGPMFKELLNIARGLGVESHCAFFGGQDPKIILPESDILIASAYENEGSSLAIKEAWASALPVICSDIPPHKEMVKDGKNGLIFKNGDPEDLADKMRSLAKDAELGEALVKAGNNRIKDFSVRRMTEQYRDIYRKISGIF